MLGSLNDVTGRCYESLQGELSSRGSLQTKAGRGNKLVSSMRLEQVKEAGIKAGEVGERQEWAL